MIGAKFIQAFWTIINSITAAGGIGTALANIDYFIDHQVSDSFTIWGIIMDKVYYFIPQETVLIIAGVFTAALLIRFFMAIVNLIKF